MKGWVKLHRQFINWEWYTEPNTKILFLHLLLVANHKSKKWRGIVIKRGQLVTSFESLSIQTGLSVRSVRTAIKNLESSREIDRQATNKFSIITICNYLDYQTEKKESDKPNDKPNDKPADNQTTTNNNNKNIRKKETTIISGSFSTSFLSFWSQYEKPVKIDEAFHIWNQLTESDIEKVLAAVPNYVRSVPEPKFRKNADNYLIDRSMWEYAPAPAKKEFDENHDIDNLIQ